MNPRSAALQFAFLSLSLVAFGQAQGAAPQTADTGQKVAVAVPVIVIHGTLNKGLNSRSATAGQVFVVKTDEALKLSDGTELPAGSDISGHVLQSTARANGAPDSTLTLTFDTLQPKAGSAALPIRGIVQAITGPPPPSVAAPAVGDMSTESTGGGVTGARISNDKIRGDQPAGDAGPDLNERSVGVIGIKNTTLKAGPVNGVDGSMFYSADKSVKLEDGSRVIVRIALKR
jgi:hypothetical protein